MTGSNDGARAGRPPDGRPKLMERVRAAIRARHYSRRTNDAYVHWIRRFIVFHGRRHPGELGEREVSAFLSSLAQRGVSASTQNQALSACLFLYQEVLGQRLPWMNEIVRAKRPVRLPVVLSRHEVKRLLACLRGPVWLMASLMYGAGLRLLECCQLRVKDISFDRGELTIRDGRVGRIGSRCCRPRWRLRCASISLEYACSTTRTFRQDAVACLCPTRCARSIQMRPVNGAGNGCFRRRASTSIARPASVGGIICTSLCFSVR